MGGGVMTTKPETTADRIARETLCLYGTGATARVSVIDLQAPEQAGEYWAHVENSGSEGFYCEVARWHEGACEWRRYAFGKYLGGELGEDVRARQCAELVAEAINTAHYDAPGIVHAMKDYQSWTREERDRAAGVAS